MPADPQALVGGEAWSKTSQVYGKTVGLVTKKAVAHLLDLADAVHPFNDPDGQGRRAIDLGAGTGPLNLSLAERNPGIPTLATDVSEAMLEQLQSLYRTQQQLLLASQRHEQPEHDHHDGSGGSQTHGADNGCRRQPAASGRGDDDDESRGTITTEILNINDIAWEEVIAKFENRYSHVLSSFAFQSVTDIHHTATGLRRLLRPGSGGIVAAAIWDFSHRDSGPLDVWAEAARSVDPAYEPPPRNIVNDLMGRDDLGRLLREAGLVDITTDVAEYAYDVEPLTVEGYLSWFWDSGNPWCVERIEGFRNGDMAAVKEAMREIVQKRYASGGGVRVNVAFAIGIAP